MKQLLKEIACLALVASVSIINATAMIIPRSQSVNAARELVGWQQFINRDMEYLYGVFSLTTEYQESFRGTRLLQCLFDDDILLKNNAYCKKNNTGSLLIQGSRVADRNPHAWLADYFGLPTDFNSVVSFKPKIQNGIFDFNAYIGFGELARGFFFRIHAPAVWTKWNLCPSENVITAGSLGFDPGYMNSFTGIPNSDLRTSFLSAADGNYQWGDMMAPLQFGIFCDPNKCNSKSLAQFSDIELALGYNFINCENCHWGLELRGSVPQGNKPCGICIFEPIVGNGQFWTMGGGVTAHAVLWQSRNCPDTSLNFYLDANVTHLFRTCQRRSFDLVGLPNSRYMLIEQLDAPIATEGNFLFAGITQASAIKEPMQYVVEGLLPLINVSTFNVDAGFAVQGDVAFKFSYITSDWDLDLGYEFWGRSKEKICLRSNSFDERKYALKGDAFIYGFGANNAAATGLANAALALSATESSATIHSGTNTPVGTNFAQNQTQNPKIDAPALAWGGINSVANATDTLQTSPNSASNTATQQNSSNPPIFITASQLTTSGAQGTYTHKIFGNISYAWLGECFSPFIGIGGEAEFGSNSCNASCTISQWGIWLKGGVAFE